MTLQTVNKCARELKRQRQQVKIAEVVLQRAVADFLAHQKISLRQSASEMGVTVAYLSDIRNGRRKVSGKIIERLAKLK